MRVEFEYVKEEVSVTKKKGVVVVDAGDEDEAIEIIHEEIWVDSEDIKWLSERSYDDTENYIDQVSIDIV